MELRRLTASDYTTSVWSGGTTTQILIHPAEAKYADRDFLWRVSSAEVSLEESDFTPLPQYNRLIATLEGEIRLQHDAGAYLRLRPGEVHAFSGASATHSVGRCTDFNLMLRKGSAEGAMQAVFAEDQTEEIFTDPAAEQVVVYCGRNACNVTVGQKNLILEPGDCLQIRDPGRTPIRIRVRPAAKQEKTTLVMVCQMWQLPLRQTI